MFVIKSRKCFSFFLDQVSEHGVVDGNSLNVVELLDQFKAHGAPNSAVAGLGWLYV